MTAIPVTEEHYGQTGRQLI